MRIVFILRHRRLNLKIEAALFEFGVFVGVETEKLGGAVAAGELLFFEGDEEAEAKDFFAEISFIERGSEDGFVEVLELSEGELGRQEFETDLSRPHGEPG